MNVLIIKTGALGDVVRMQYFAKYLHLQKGFDIFWFAAKDSKEILLKNPHIREVFTAFNDVKNIKWDIIYSLEDDFNIINFFSKIDCKKRVGFFIDKHKIKYCGMTAKWNDMGIHSKYGLKTANKLKLLNKDSHIKIFSKIFDLENVLPNFKGVIPSKRKFANKNIVIGINPFAGRRWPNKSLNKNELIKTLSFFLTCKSIYKVYCFGCVDKWHELISRFENNKLILAKTRSIDNFFSSIRKCDYLITADSLGVHLAAAAGVPYVCFFGPTSASEVTTPIRPFINLRAKRNTYCTYNPKTQIEGLTARRIVFAFKKLIYLCNRKQRYI